jgi:hypothetical protein
MIVATSVGAVVAAGALWALAWHSVMTPVDDLVSTSPVGVPDWESLLFYLAVLCVTPVASAVAVLVSAWVLRSLARPFVARATQCVAILMSIALFGLTALALARVSTRPGIDAYLEDLYEHSSHGHISAKEGERNPTGERPPPRQPTVREYRDTVDDVTVVRACDDRGSCVLNVVEGADAPISDEPSPLRGPRVRGDAALVVLRIAPDLLLVKGVYSLRPNLSPEERSISAFRRIESRWQDEQPFRLELIVQRTNTPIAWLDCGMAGAGLTLVLWAIRVLVSLGHRRANAQNGRNAGGVASVYRKLFVEATGEPLAAEYSLLRVDAAILAVACCTASPLVAAALIGLLR